MEEYVDASWGSESRTKKPEMNSVFGKGGNSVTAGGQALP
jgi:hypothetical protein